MVVAQHMPLGQSVIQISAVEVQMHIAHITTGM